MAKHAACRMPCAEYRPHEIEFLRAPDELDDGNEINTRNWDEWTRLGGAYASIATQGNRSAGRQLELAGQAVGVVDAIIKTEWNELTRTIDHGCAIKLEKFGIVKYYHIVQAVNVNEACVDMMFLCRHTTPGGNA